jgi:hypothetical protein
MPTIDTLKNIHQGETAVICGGGVSLPFDLRQIEAVDRIIGVNQHSLILPLDYLCFLDRHMWPLVKEFRDTKLVTKLNKYYGESHVIHANVAPPIGYSGAFAIWVADYFGFDRVDVCGMDQYEQRKDEREYWWQGPQTGPGNRHKLCKADLGLLKKFIDELQHPERVFFTSGRLKEIHQ